ncbi:MAG: hypothetical protein QXM75_03595 [Candidatus Diapherotrites archaeon]
MNKLLVLAAIAIVAVVLIAAVLVQIMPSKGDTSSTLTSQDEDKIAEGFKEILIPEESDIAIGDVV